MYAGTTASTSCRLPSIDREHLSALTHLASHGASMLVLLHNTATWSLGPVGVCTKPRGAP